MLENKFSSVVGPDGQKRQKVYDHKTPVLDAFNLDRPEHSLHDGRKRSIDLKKLDTICQDQDQDSKEDSPSNNKEQRRDSDL